MYHNVEVRSDAPELFSVVKTIEQRHVHPGSSELIGLSLLSDNARDGKSLDVGVGGGEQMGQNGPSSARYVSL
jgi:hypothetical protein